VATAIVSARTRDQLKDNIGVAGWELPAEHRRDLERVSRPRLTYPHDLHRLLGCAPKLG
jgi:aryl-alcohol dehydrogenase-like predicted oxidoreductase